MTQLDVMYHYGAAPSERSLLALSKVRDVYGVRLVEVREAEKTVRVEYDASRLTGAAIHKLLRRAGLDIASVVTSKPAIEIGLRRDCFTLPHSV